MSVIDELAKAIAHRDEQDGAGPWGSPWCNQDSYRDQARAVMRAFVEIARPFVQWDEEGILDFARAVGRGTERDFSWPALFKKEQEEIQRTIDEKPQQG